METPFDEGLIGRADAPFAPGGGVATATARVCEDLRRRIVSLDLPPGSTLSRNSLAEEYEVSLGPIREAMHRLERDGLVNVYPQSRTVVSKIDEAELYEAHFLRLSVEAEVARRLAETRDPGVLSKARTILKMQEALAEDQDQIAIFYDLDDSFHRTLFAGVGQTRLQTRIKAKGGHLARARRLELPKAGRTQVIIQGHRAVLDAIEAGDPAGAQAAMREHLTGTVSRIHILRGEYPDFFKPAG